MELDYEYLRNCRPEAVRDYVVAKYMNHIVSESYTRHAPHWYWAELGHSNRRSWPKYRDHREQLVKLMERLCDEQRLSISSLIEPSKIDVNVNGFKSVGKHLGTLVRDAAFAWLVDEYELELSEES